MSAKMVSTLSVYPQLEDVAKPSTDMEPVPSSHQHDLPPQGGHNVSNQDQPSTRPSNEHPMSFPDSDLQHFRRALPPRDNKPHRHKRHLRETVVEGGTLHRNFQRRFQGLQRQMEAHEGRPSPDYLRQRQGRDLRGHGRRERGQGHRDHMYLPMINDHEVPFRSLGDKLRRSPRVSMDDGRSGWRNDDRRKNRMPPV